jgi:serine O-acetyltransferase
VPCEGRAFDPDWLSFACVLIRREVIERIGDLDELSCAPFTDVDFCRRARAAGFCILYWPQAKVMSARDTSSKRPISRERAPREHYVARARYFARFYGRAGLWRANALWHLGRCVGVPREIFGAAPRSARKRELLDIWIQAWQPLRAGHGESSAPRPRRRSYETSLSGSRNQNPTDIGLLALIGEDFRTYDRNVFEPGLWAVILHRLGNARMDLQPRFLRMPFSLAYRVAFTAASWLWGIDLSYAVKLGRRVRIWHHGGIVLNALSIGDDVHIRHNTTFGIVRRGETEDKPHIGNACDIGVGVCVLGNVVIGDGCVIGANSVVLTDLPAGTTAVGAPARAVRADTQEDAVETQQPEPEAASPVPLRRRGDNAASLLRPQLTRRTRS